MLELPFFDGTELMKPSGHNDYAEEIDTVIPFFVFVFFLILIMASCIIIYKDNYWIIICE